MGLLPAHRPNCQIQSYSSSSISIPFLPPSLLRPRTKRGRGAFLTKAAPLKGLAPLSPARPLAPSVPSTSSSHLLTLFRAAQGAAGITGMGRSLWIGDKNKSSPVLLPLVRLSLEVPLHLLSQLYPAPSLPPLLPGYLLPGFARYRPEAGANPKVRAEWRSLSPGQPQFQGPSARSGCCQLSPPERKYQEAEEGEGTSS